MNKVYNNWCRLSDDEPYEPSPETHGIVYAIEDRKTGMYYVGKKQVHKNKPLGKRELAKIEKIDKRVKYTKVVETNWRTYTTSNKTLSELINTFDLFRNERFKFIVMWECYDETALKFRELQEIIATGAFTNKTGYNDNIQIKQIGRIRDLEKRSEAV